jgi:hypothetical protein
LFSVGPLSRENLRKAISKPAEMAGFHFEQPSMIEEMLDHLETRPGALPLLQFTASQLWETRDIAERRLTHHSYVSMGGLVGAFASHADQFIAGLSAQNTSLVRAILLQLITAERTCATVPISELRELLRETDEIQRLIDQMVDAHLLVVQAVEARPGPIVKITHESMIEGWPTLRRWFDENQADAQLTDQLRVAARAWQVKGFDAGLLWRGESAAKATKFRMRYKGPLSDIDRSFLDAVFSQQISLARRRRATIIAGFAALSLLVIAMIALLAIIQESRTEAEDNLTITEVARAEAERQLGLAQTKERQWLAAEVANKATEADATAARGKLGEFEAQLRIANVEVAKALAEETESKNRAVRAQQRAEVNKARAEKFETEARARAAIAVKAKDDMKRTYDKEHDRAERLARQLFDSSR